MWVGLCIGTGTFFAIVGDVFSEKSLHNVVMMLITALCGTGATVMWWALFQQRISGPKVYAAAAEVTPAAGVMLCLLGTICGWVAFMFYLCDHLGVSEATYDIDDDGEDDDDENYVRTQGGAGEWF